MSTKKNQKKLWNLSYVKTTENYQPFVTNRIATQKNIAQRRSRHNYFNKQHKSIHNVLINWILVSICYHSNTIANEIHTKTSFSFFILLLSFPFFQLSSSVHPNKYQHLKNCYLTLHKIMKYFPLTMLCPVWTALLRDFVT